MGAATEHLRGLARAIVAAALERVGPRAALLAGSVGRGEADFYSDIDLLLYVDELPPEETLTEIREAVGGTNPKRKERTEHACGEEFDLGGVRTEVVFFRAARVEWWLEQLVDQPAEIEPVIQKVLSGVLESRPLHGADLIESWKERLREYPEALRRTMVERHWSFFPLWYHGESMAVRDAELWRLDSLLEGAFNLLGVLAGLNRLYFARFQFKGMRGFVSRMKIAPPDLADRLESLFRLDPDAAAAEFERLVAETQALVKAELPDADVTLRFPPGTRQRPWSI